ncbi:MAG: peptidylprolyl isomerase [Chloroflexota bacterium]
MPKAQNGDTVVVHYTGKHADSTVFDSSQDRDPLTFTLGKGELISGFEQAVLGMEPGESRTTTIPAEQAYGQHEPNLITEVSRDQLPSDLEIAVGQSLQLQHPDGMTIPVSVTEISETSVTLDANHPLAGQDLTFEIQLVAIQ